MPRFVVLISVPFLLIVAAIVHGECSVSPSSGDAASCVSKIPFPNRSASNREKDPNRRMKELIIELQLIDNEWNAIRSKPGHLTPDRVHGGIQ